MQAANRIPLPPAPGKANNSGPRNSWAPCASNLSWLPRRFTPMHKHASVSLDIIEIANPCPASWEKMRGDDRVRFCEECQLNVYNVCAIPREAALKLLNERGEGRGVLCVGWYKRGDGTVISAGCGGGLRTAARRAARFAGAAAALVLRAAMAPLMLGASSRTSRDPSTSVGPME